MTEPIQILTEAFWLLQTFWSCWTCFICRANQKAFKASQHYASKRVTNSHRRAQTHTNTQGQLLFVIVQSRETRPVPSLPSQYQPWPRPSCQGRLPAPQYPFRPRQRLSKHLKRPRTKRRERPSRPALSVAALSAPRDATVSFSQPLEGQGPAISRRGPE